MEKLLLLYTVLILMTRFFFWKVSGFEDKKSHAYAEEEVEIWVFISDYIVATSLAKSPFVSTTDTDIAQIFYSEGMQERGYGNYMCSMLFVIKEKILVNLYPNHFLLKSLFAAPKGNRGISISCIHLQKRSMLHF